MFDRDEIYDLRADPGELNNLLAPPGGERLLGRGPLDTIPAICARWSKPSTGASGPSASMQPADALLTPTGAGRGTDPSFS